MGKYGESLYCKIVKYGQLDFIMDEMRDGEYLFDDIEVSFFKVKDNMSYFFFSLIFDFYYEYVLGGLVGIILVFGLEGFGEDFLSFKMILQEIVKFDFVCKCKFSVV